MSCKILITGDFCPIGRNVLKIENNDYSVFGDFVQFLGKVDFSVTNLESPLTLCENKNTKAGPNIRINPKAAKMLSSIGFRLVTLANNHILDYGKQGIEDTITYCEQAKLDYVGAGKNIEEAKKPYITVINNIKVGFLNFAENEFCAATENDYGANPINIINNHYDIKKTKEQVDVLFVIVHGGREYYQLPTPQQRERYRFYIDSGADIVVGHHTHCYSGYEIYKKKPIFYSLGNFIFDASRKKNRNGLWTQGYGVMFTLNHNDIIFDLIPYNQGRKENPQLELLDNREKVVFDNDIKHLNNIIVNDNLFNDEWNKYLTTQGKNYKGLLLLQSPYIREAIRRGWLPPVFFHSKSHQLLLLNFLRCETQREILTDIFENELLNYKS